MLSVATPVSAAKNEACLQSYESAQLNRLKGHYTAARDQLLICAQSTCPGVIRRDCINWLAEVDASLPSLVFAVSDSSGQDLVEVRVLATKASSAQGESQAPLLLTERIDGRAVSLDPGVYELRFESARHEPIEQTITVHEAQKQRLVRVQLTVNLHPPVTSSSPDSLTEGRSPYLLSYALAGGALAGAALGTTLAVLGKQEYDRLEQTCQTDGCTADQRAQGKRQYIAADISFAVAGGLGVAALWTYLVTRREHAAADRMTVSASFANGPYLGARFRF